MRGLSLSLEWVDENHDLSKSKDYSGPSFYVDSASPGAVFDSWFTALNKLSHADAIELAERMDRLTGSDFARQVREHLSEYAAHLEGIVASARTAVEAAKSAQAELDALESSRSRDR